MRFEKGFIIFQNDLGQCSPYLVAAAVKDECVASIQYNSNMVAASFCLDVCYGNWYFSAFKVNVSSSNRCLTSQETLDFDSMDKMEEKLCFFLKTLIGTDGCSDGLKKNVDMTWVMLVTFTLVRSNYVWIFISYLGQILHYSVFEACMKCINTVPFIFLAYFFWHRKLHIWIFCFKM